MKEIVCQIKAPINAPWTPKWTKFKIQYKIQNKLFTSYKTYIQIEIPFHIFFLSEYINWGKKANVVNDGNISDIVVWTSDCHLYDIVNFKTKKIIPIKYTKRIPINPASFWFLLNSLL
ncbi:hypothetical protein NW064_06265 [Mycoplasmopsis felis]|uniref:hypothetical protein n=1 Tax=Mycoplasmopsis felis TaxID=33923 RepID=UPI0021B07E9B|nr:hypothetical protein [Mycoplasmopsis felis]UWW00765.1 hypothetical protein NW064_06265 [Mycoplasmopsis felis]